MCPLEDKPVTRREALGLFGRAIIGGRLVTGSLPFLLSACATHRTPAELARRMIIAIPDKIQTLDPAFQTMALDSFIIVNIMDTLTWYTREIKLVPRLALSWSSPDGARSWIFKLRPGVKFHDGTPLNAEAVKFHFDRIKDPATKSKRKTKVLALESVEPIDDLTVKFHMNEPFSVWPVVVRDSFAGIVSPAAVAKYGNENFTLHPVGTGPYMFHEQRGEEYLRLKKNPHYWNKEQFFVEEVEFRVVREATTRLILLEQGAIDLCDLSFANAEVAKRSKHVNVIDGPMLSIRYIGLNCMKPPFDNPIVRRALNHGINREDLVKYGFRGFAQPDYGPLPEPMPAYDKNIKKYKFDPELAKALLKQAGITKPLNVTMWTTDDPTGSNLGIVVADQLRRIGVNIEVLRFDSSVYWDKFDTYQKNGTWFPTKEGVFDMFSGAWVGGEHPFSYLDPLFRSTSTSNAVFYKNPELDKELKLSLQIVDEVDRQKIYDKIQEMIVDDAPWIFCYSGRSMWAVNPRVKGLHQHPAGEYEFNGVTLAGEGAA